MFRTDTGNFNRFLTSLGLLLLLGALLVPYFYFHDTETLRISGHELRGLTEVGREALETRQRRQADLEIWALILAGSLALCGIGALWFGGRRLRVAQVKEDAAIDRKAKRDDVEIEQMSQSEVEEKQEVQAREAVEAEDEDRTAPQQAAAGPAPVKTKNLGDIRYRENRDAIVRIEAALRTSLEEMAVDSYEFLPEVKTSRASQQLRLDGLFRAKSRDGTDVILEMKIMRQSRMIRSRSRPFADTVLALIARYTRMTKREATGWLLIVMPQEAEPLPLSERRQLEDLLNSSLIGVAKATVVHEFDLAKLPQRFVQLFVAQAK